jgi:hypothetical protein
VIRVDYHSFAENPVSTDIATLKQIKGLPDLEKGRDVSGPVPPHPNLLNPAKFFLLEAEAKNFS